MSKELDELRAECDHAKQQVEIWRNREERAKQRISYQRSAKDRKRPHHLIQYQQASHTYRNHCRFHSTCHSRCSDGQ